MEKQERELIDKIHSEDITSIYISVSYNTGNSFSFNTGNSFSFNKKNISIVLNNKDQFEEFIKHFKMVGLL